MNTTFIDPFLSHLVLIIFKAILLDSTYPNAKALDDPFEPEDIKAALEDPCCTSLAYLIFGYDEAARLGFTLPQQDDPLTALYH
jgi:hypothetical protein